LESYLLVLSTATSGDGVMKVKEAILLSILCCYSHALLFTALRTMSRYSCCNRTKGGGKNVIVMYTCKDNLTPLLYSGKIKKKKEVLAMQ